MVADRAQLIQQVAALPVCLVILDINTPGIGLRELVPQLRGLVPAATSIVAFGPHVDQAGLETARDVGCDQVLARGQFHARVAAILAQTGQQTDAT